MEFNLHGYGAGSHSSDVAKQYRNLRVKIDFERSRLVKSKSTTEGVPRLFCSFAGITNKKSESDNNRCSLRFSEGSASENLYAANCFLDAALALAEVEGGSGYAWVKPSDVTELQVQLTRLADLKGKLEKCLQARQLKPPE